jgi:DNA-binding transcriptional MerR regulator
MRRGLGTSDRSFERWVKQGLVPAPQRDTSGHRWWTTAQFEDARNRVASWGLPRRKRERASLTAGRQAKNEEQAIRRDLKALVDLVPRERLGEVLAAVKRVL